MVEVMLAFVTGLTTGGLSCLAVQGGLLASSLAHEIENAPALKSPAHRKSTSNHHAKKKVPPRTQPVKQHNPDLALPILAFLGAKLMAYTVLGFFLGLIGSMFQLSPMLRAIFQIAIGVFMVGTALRMLNVHPFFRVFALEPPASVRRFIRRKSNESPDDTPGLLAPIFLGLLTVLIPCGVTQAMMAVALATGDPVKGATLMFAFTLGTSPVFFAVSYFATRLGARLEKNFTRFVAVVVLLLGLYTIDTGLTVAGAPMTVTRLVSQAASAVTPSEAQAAPSNELEVYSPGSVENTTPSQPEDVEGDNIVTVEVKNGGYFPAQVVAKAGQPATLRLVSNETYTCALSFVIPSLGIQRNLEPTDEVRIDIPAQAAGSTLPFSCSMGMYVGEIVFE